MDCDMWESHEVASIPITINYIVIRVLIELKLTKSIGRAARSII